MATVQDSPKTNEDLRVHPFDASETRRDEILPPAGGRGTARATLHEMAYFACQLREEWRLLSGAILLGLACNVLRLPLLYLPAILTGYFQQTQGRNTSGGVVVDASDRMMQFGVGILRSAFGDAGYPTAAVAIALAGVLALGPMQLIRSYWSGLAGANLLLRLRQQVFGRLGELNVATVYEQGAGPFVQRVTRDLFLLCDLLAGSFLGIVGMVLQVVMFLTALLLIDSRLTIMILVAYVALQPVLLLFNRRIERQSGKLQTLQEEVISQMVEGIGGHRDIIAAGCFSRMADRFRETSQQLRRESVRALLWSQGSELLLTVAFSLLTAVPYFLVVRRLDRVDQVGQMITYVGLLSSLLPAMAGLWGTTIDLAVALPSVHALYELLAGATGSRPKRRGRSARRAIVSHVESIRFDGVGLKLAGRWILRDLSFEIAGGQLTALIGQSGAGKTSIFHLLLRLAEPTCGSIWINEMALTEFDEEDLRRLIGFIPQNPYIFKASLRENLMVAVRRELADDGLAEAIDGACLQPLVDSRCSDGGLDAPVGYMGMNLSAGERQRIALGRLLVQDPQVVVCDEHTANIDVRTAQLIQATMRTRFADRTRLIITHELYNARGADRILVLDQGRIVQSGSHRELMKVQGLYRALWDTQRLE